MLDSRIQAVTGRIDLRSLQRNARAPTWAEILLPFGSPCNGGLYVLNRRKFCAGLLTFPSALAAMPAQLLAQLLVWDGSGQIRFQLNNPLDHPFYWWPRTLLGYRVRFEKPVDLRRLRLARTDTGEHIPIQFSEADSHSGTLRTAMLHFFADLPAGARREFVLHTADDTATGAVQVREMLEDTSIVLDTGAMRVRIPATQTVAGEAPGPVMQVARGASWVGSSSFHIHNDRVTQITTRRTANGPLFLAYEIAYDTAGGSRYVATVQAQAGQDFVRLHEDMEGLKPGISGEFRSQWKGFNATHRQAPNHPAAIASQIGDYDAYKWERIGDPEKAPDVYYGSSRPIYQAFNPKGELPFRLGVYQTWNSFKTGTFANFWDQASDNALGVFIDRPTDWRDHEYAYEVESPTLQVRFHYQDEQFFWIWPLARGSRSTCLAFYDHTKDKQAMHDLEQAYLGIKQDDMTYAIPFAFTSHTLFLQNRYGTLDLNRVKDWVLEYPDTSKQPNVIFTSGDAKTADDLEHRLMTSLFVTSLPLLGTRQNGGLGPITSRRNTDFSPVPARQVQRWWIDGFNRLRGEMNARQRVRLTAMFLLMAYVNAGEDFMPLVPMLSGHPNFLGDVKSIPPSMSFLFPEHPMATAWADMWEKSVELNTRYNTRPAVTQWNAEGGRWTEDLGTYVWAFLRPTLHADFLLRQFDGVERFLSPQLAEMCNWLVNALSAPFNGESAQALRDMEKNMGHTWGVWPADQGPRRVYPPQGAHSERRVPPRSLWYLGTCLRRYAPLAAEHAMWAARPTDQDMEEAPGNLPPWDDIMYREPDNRGTNPRLRSRKYTGYGIVLRAGVDTADEISIHLQQIDEGPNYRWGRCAEGGCGGLYYFAAGKGFGFNGQEDVGDRRDQDTDFSTNFGVYKDGEFKAIGQNVLDQPFYDLGVGQFASIVPRQSPTQYAAPEYVSRSVLLAGHDYFVLYDQVMNESVDHRLSWFVRRDDELPAIHLVRGASPSQPRSTQETDLQTAYSTGKWFDGRGDSMAVVSHRHDLKVTATPYGCHVQAGDLEDIVFRNPEPVQFSNEGNLFSGTAGLIRRRSAITELALFHGTAIGCPQLAIRAEHAQLAISAKVQPSMAASGEYETASACTVKISVPSLPAKAAFYVDGEAQSGQRQGNELTLRLQAGRHHWELTDKLPIPIAPQIMATENRAGGARVLVTSVAAASQYRLELSKDGGSTWLAVATAARHELEVDGLSQGEKVHLRAVALNAEQESEPGPDYPLYVTSEAPLPPDGLRVDLAEGAAHLSWGEVLGVTEYRLYVRRAQDKQAQLLYHGRERTYEDRSAGLRAPAAVPDEAGSETAASIEYCVSAVNGNGEGPRSRTTSSDPRSWRNWNPLPDTRFRRVYSYASGSQPDADDRPRFYPS